MNELQITNEDIELLKEMKENCLKADAYDDEKRLLKANAITKFLNLYNNWNELKNWLIQLQKFKGINQQGFSWGVAQEVLDKMQELEQGKNENN